MEASSRGPSKESAAAIKKFECVSNTTQKEVSIALFNKPVAHTGMLVTKELIRPVFQGGVPIFLGTLGGHLFICKYNLQLYLLLYAKHLSKCFVSQILTFIMLKDYIVQVFSFCL